MSTSAVRRFRENAVAFENRRCECGSTFTVRPSDTRTTCPSCRTREADRIRHARAERKRQAQRLRCRTCDTELLVAVPNGLCGFCDPEHRTLDLSAEPANPIGGPR